MTREQQKAELLRRSDYIIDEVAQMIRDVEWWNNNRLDAPPMDCEPERLLLCLLKKQRAAFAAEDLELQAALKIELDELAKTSFADL